MAKSKTDKTKRSDKSEEPHTKKTHFAAGPRPFWTGVVAFGLVTLRVSLYPANRGKDSSLVMVDRSGTRLRRRYKCAKEQKMLSADDIIRGYEVEKDQFVTVEDDELKALAPEKSNEINLQRFVSLDEINPIYFDKGYFLAPDADAIKAYRLLAESMEQENRAGIATFVMREREYLVAIVAQAGILRAETLRFHDEIRTPAEIGLGEMPTAPTELVDQLRSTFRSLTAERLDRDKLTDDASEQLLQKVQEKLQKNQDVVSEKRATTKSTAAPEDYEGSAEIIDLMQVIKARIRGDKDIGQSAQTQQDTTTKGNKPAPTQRKSQQRKAPSGKAKPHQTRSSLQQLSRDQLYQEAQRLNISGRGKMSKAQLVDALAKS